MSLSQSQDFIQKQDEQKTLGRSAPLALPLAL